MNTSDVGRTHRSARIPVAPAQDQIASGSESNPANAVFRAVQRIACSNHRRDDQGWPLGNCTECVSYRKQMDAWYTAQVMAGEHRPGAEMFDTDKMHDRDAERRDGEDYTVNPQQGGS